MLRANIVHKSTGRHAAVATFLRLVGRGLIAAGLLFLCATGHHLRAEPAGDCLTGDWIAEATRFVAEETGNPVPEVCIRFASLEQLVALVPSVTSGRAHTESIAAVFVPAMSLVQLADDLDPDAPLSHSYLVHELVHAQQFARHAHERAVCPGALEGEAYNLQALYLTSKGLRQDAFLLQVLGMLQGACEYSY